MTTVRLSKGLLSATREALEILNRHYPRKFALAMQSNEAASQYVEEYAAALVFCDFDKIPAAARQWVATEKFGPSAAELGEVARGLTFAGRPTAASAPGEAPLPTLNKNGPRIDALYYAAKERLIERGYKRALFAGTIAQIWALLFESQASDEQRESVRAGEVELDVWFATVDAWVGGARPTPHPMNNVGEAIPDAIRSMAS